MKIKVIRDYSGEEGEGPDKNVRAGTEHTVTRARGNALKANGLVEIISDEAEDEEEVVDEKAAPKPENKKAPEPANKAAPDAAKKGDSK